MKTMKTLNLIMGIIFLALGISAIVTAIVKKHLPYALLGIVLLITGYVALEEWYGQHKEDKWLKKFKK